MRYHILLLLVLACASVFAQENQFEETVQELFIAETVYPQAKGEIQLTGSHSLYKYSWDKFNTTALEAEYGITNRFQMGVGFAYSFWNKADISDFDPIEVSAMYNVINTSGHALSFALELEIPTGSEDEIAFTPRVIGAKQVGNWQLHAGLGLEIEDDLGLSYDVAAVYPLQPIMLSLEFNGTYVNDNHIFITPGCTYVPGDLFQLGLGIPLHVVGDEPGFGVIFGLTFEFGD